MTSSPKGAVIVNAYWKGGDEGAKRIKDALSALGIPMALLRANEVRLRVGERGVTGEFPFDFAVFLDKDDHLARLLEAKGVRLFHKFEKVHIDMSEVYSDVETYDEDSEEEEEEAEYNSAFEDEDKNKDEDSGSESDEEAEEEKEDNEF